MADAWLLALIAPVVTPISFLELKLWLVDQTGLAKDALHVHIALLVFVATRLCWRARFGWAGAWLAALAVTLTGEWLDLRATMVDGPIKPDANHVHDIWNSMLWPTILALVGQWLPWRPKSEPAAAPLASPNADTMPDG